jgi:hypothetical protein
MGDEQVIPELITQAQANALFGALFVLGLVLAPVAFLIARRRGGDGLLAALLWGGPPVLVGGVLWPVYNAITNHLGLDTVVNLLVNLGLFVVVGALVGVGWSWLIARRQPTPVLTTGEGDSETEGGPPLSKTRVA